MTIQAVAIVAAIVFFYGLASRSLTNRSISGPLVFTIVGALVGPWAFDVVGGEFGEGGVEVLAEATLVLILFADATRIDLRVLRNQTTLPVRMLGIGLPLTVVFGTLAAMLLFSDLGLWEAALVAAILAPTDAALGQAVVSNPRVPVRVRQALNVESGLNDGLMLPAITILLAVAAAEAGIESSTNWVVFVAQQVGLGLLVGLVVGCVGGWALDYCSQRNWVEGVMRQLATLSVAVGAFALANAVGGNGFVAAFIAGMAFGFVATESCESAADFTEDEGQLLALLTFLFFGALLLGPRLADLSPSIAIYALVSLTVVRMVPLALSVIGVGLELPTIGYLGWFGPRGLASILFGLFVVEEVELAGSETMLDIVTWTVFASIVLHGLTAGPFANRYGNWFEAMMNPSDADGTPIEMDPMVEAEPVAEMRQRLTPPGD
ncbi:MAG: cation:proton antiporter [Acidimicrobiales bacterium]